MKDASKAQNLKVIVSAICLLITPEVFAQESQ